ncbi:hypothetical protein [Flavobacterium tegetincola]|uniref:hypothetical protein n=1 Tax=Flavobacterium tegetincola TaxID=150172 RepID=UPI0004262925|nr:hypothetical protein [Flavobacterium tegetincola]
MTKIYFLVLCFLTFGVLSAQEKLSKEEQARREKNIQAGNPFAKFGYKGKVATLSKGKYLEVHDLDSIVTIGSIRYHVDNKQIVGNIVIDTTNIYARPIGDTPSRWLSPDPLSEEFPDWSPYSFSFNSPLKYNDPTGMAPESVIPPDDYVFNEKGHYVRTDKTNTPDMLVIENSKTSAKSSYTFNDPKTDVASINYNINKYGSQGFKEHQFVFGIDNSWMNFFKKESGIEQKNYFSRTFFAATESVGGKMDPSVYSLSLLLYSAGEYYNYDAKTEILGDKGPLYMFQNDGYRVYNHLDSGNFLWGNFMNGLGFSSSDAMNYAKDYNKNDTSSDINAIQRGSTLNNSMGIYGNLPITNEKVNEVQK